MQADPASPCCSSLLLSQPVPRKEASSGVQVQEALPQELKAPSVPWEPLGCLHRHSLAAPSSLGPEASQHPLRAVMDRGCGLVVKEQSLTAGALGVYGAK